MTLPSSTNAADNYMLYVVYMIDCDVYFEDNYYKTYKVFLKYFDINNIYVHKYFVFCC